VSERLREEAGWLWDALQAEWFKVTRRRMTYICLGVFSALVLLFYVILWLRIREGPGDRASEFAFWIALRGALSFRNVVPYSLNLERFFATLVCVIFAGTMMGNEYDWRTVGVVTSRGVRRWHFVFAKAVSGVVFTVVCLLLGFLVAMAASAWFTNLYGLNWGAFDAARVADILTGLLRTTFVILPFVFLSLLLSTVWRSAGQAVGAALGIFFMEGIFIALLNAARGWISYLPDFFFSVNVDAVMRGNGTFSDNGGGPFILGSGGPPEWRGLLVLAAWISLFVLGAFWRFQRRDIQE